MVTRLSSENDKKKKVTEIIDKKICPAQYHQS